MSKIDSDKGALAIVPKELDGAIVSSDFPVFKVDTNKTDLKYLDYCLRYGNFADKLYNHVKGTTNRRRIKADDIMNLLLFLPSKEEQALISARIEKQHKIILHAEDSIKALRDGIVDKSDFEGNWDYKYLQDVCIDIKSGGTPSRANMEYFNGDIPWVKISDFNELDYIYKTEEKITQDGLTNSSAKILPKGTILVSIFATIGSISILGVDACTNQAIAGLIPDTKIISTEYLMYYMHTLKPYYTLKSRGVTQNNINMRILKSVKIPVPPLETQSNIVKNIESRQPIFKELEKTKDRSLRVINEIMGEIGLV